VTTRASISGVNSEQLGWATPYKKNITKYVIQLGWATPYKKNITKLIQLGWATPYKKNIIEYIIQHENIIEYNKNRVQFSEREITFCTS